MTRDNKQWRNDQRPSYRNTSSNQNGEEYSSYSTRPRLNREAVDRAWKDGAQPQHADYHPRTPRRPFPPNHRNGQRPGYSSTYEKPSHTRFNGERRDNTQHDGRPPYSNQEPRSRSFESDRQNTGGHHFPRRNSYPEQSQGYQDRRHDYAPEYRGRRASYSDRDERSFPPRRPWEAQNQRRQTDRSFYQDEHPRPPHRYDTEEPARRRYEGRRYEERPFKKEQFEGDYEQFTGYAEPHSRHFSDRISQQPAYRDSRRDKRQDRDASQQEPESHVTRLPDGRVLKGPRPAQRKNARFWTEISEDTQELVQQVHVPEPTQEEVPAEHQAQETSKKGPKHKAVSGKKPQKQTASAVSRKKKADEPKKAHTPGPRPSQRGFKWPTP